MCAITMNGLEVNVSILKEIMKRTFLGLIDEIRISLSYRRLSSTQNYWTASNIIQDLGILVYSNIK